MSAMNQYQFKECPVCKAVVFSDMDVCYGCMHHFSLSEGNRLDAEPNPIPAALSMPVVATLEEEPLLSEDDDAQCGLDFPEIVRPNQPLIPQISSMPSPESSEKRWLLRIQIKDPSAPAKSWEFELAEADISSVE